MILATVSTILSGIVSGSDPQMACTQHIQAIGLTIRQPGATRTRTELTPSPTVHPLSLLSGHRSTQAMALGISKSRSFRVLRLPPFRPPPSKLECTRPGRVRRSLARLKRMASDSERLRDGNLFDLGRDRILDTLEVGWVVCPGGCPAREFTTRPLLSSLWRSAMLRMLPLHTFTPTRRPFLW